MNLATCTVRFLTNTNKVIYISGTLSKILQLPGTGAITLHLGKSSMEISVKRLKKRGNLIYIPEAIKHALNIPRQGKCAIVSNDTGEIRIGPLIGVLTYEDSITQTAKLKAVRTYVVAGAGKAFCFAFTPSDINWQQETVSAYFPAANGAWVKKTVPLPDVVYNRVTNRRLENSQLMENFKERLTKRNIPVFNWSFFDKWDLYNILEGDEAETHVPESHADPSGETVRDMLEKHRFVYLKPTAGSLGIGIYRLTYHSKKGYFARYRQNGRNVLLRFAQFPRLMYLLGRHKGRMKNHVIQQGIRLIELDSCPIDFRFHMNKNGQNRWVVAGIGAKKAGRGSVTTHVKNGGQILIPEQVLNRIYGERADEVLQNTKRVAIKLAEAIEKGYSHQLGELGFDIGIDQKEKIWMFEANAKPGRSIFKHPSLSQQGRESLNCIIDHCFYLSDFRSRRNA